MPTDDLPPAHLGQGGASAPPSSKGKERASEPVASASASDEASAPAKQTSLLRSALGHSADLTSSLSDILTSSGKGAAAERQGRVPGASAVDPSLLASAPTPSTAASHSGTGPRQGFRTTTVSTASGPPLASPSSTSSFPAVANLNNASSSAAEYGSFEALDRGLHDVVRRQSLNSTSRLSRAGQRNERGERRSSHERDAQGRDSSQDQHGNPSTEDLLDPAYHEAWASSIPIGGAVSSDPRSAQYAEQDADLVQAWERALRPASEAPALVPGYSEGGTATGSADQALGAWPASDGRPAPGAIRTAEQGGFMNLLAAEEAATEEQERRQATGSGPADEIRLQGGSTGQERSKAVEEAEAYQPAPEPLHALQSTDPREALSFLLGPSTSSTTASSASTAVGEDSKARLRAELADLKSRLEEAEGADTTGTGAAPGGGAAPVATSGLDRTARRIQRRAQLVRIEYDLSVLEGRLGYHEEVNGPYAAAAYASPPDLTKLIDEGGEEKLETESEMDQRRRRAIERLESLRRHLDAKL